MRFGKIDIPQDVLFALEEGRLVIFAGAGVSMGSGLPSFSELTRQICKSFTHEPPGRYVCDRDCDNKDGCIGKGPEPAMERILGSLHDIYSTRQNQHPVHQRCVEIIGNEKYQHNTQHRDLLRLFTQEQNVRLVTTNFDTLFPSAAKELGWSGIQVHHAPALPLGRTFHGIVHLHGSVTQGPKDLILIDRDFSSAYLTDGFARRFLLGLFSQYLVLFVGYSHSDTVMEYLARGLVKEQSKQRFALTGDEDKQPWRDRGIEPIYIPQSEDPENSFQNLYVTLERWADHSCHQAIDRLTNIKRIVENGVPVDLEEIDYILWSFKRPETVRYFCEYATDPAWLLWAAETFWDSQDKGRGRILDALFQDERPLSEIEQRLANWFADRFMLAHPEEALLVIHKNGPKQNLQFWNILSDYLNTSHGNEPIEPQLLGRWLRVLFNVGHHPNRNLSFLIAKLDPVEYKDQFTILVSYLTYPVFELKESYLSILSDDNEDEGMKTFGDVVLCQIDDYLLGDLIAKRLEPNMDILALPLLPVVTHHLTRTHLLFTSAGEGDARGDPVNWKRSAVEEHSQDDYKDTISYLVDIARIILDWFIKNDARRANEIINQWADSSAPLLKRLAIYGIGHRRRVKSDYKIKWLLERDWLYTYGLKHEVFQLLKAAYPQASQSVRMSLINRALRGDQFTDPSQTSDSSKVFNLLVWLQRCDPDCLLVEQPLSEIRKAHPEWSVLAHPDFDIYLTSSTGTIQSPYTVKELLSRNPADREFLKELCEFRDVPFGGPSRQGLQLTLSAAAAEDQQWGIEVLSNLLLKNLFRRDLGWGLVEGLERGNLTDLSWSKLLLLISNQKELSRIGNTVSRLVRDGIVRGDNSIPDHLIDLSEIAADFLWNNLDESDRHKPDSTMPPEKEPGRSVWRGEVTSGTWLAEFWLHLIARKWKQSGSDWVGIPDNCRNALEKARHDDSKLALSASISIGRNLGFLHDADPDWVKKQLLPLMDWRRAKKHTEYLWAGYLRGNWHHGLMYDLRPYYLTAFEKLSTLNTEDSEMLADSVAITCIHFSENPFEDNWLNDFITSSKPADRDRFTDSICRRVEKETPELIEKLWDDWIQNYWENRTKHRPVAVERKEAARLIRWLLPLKSYFEELVEQLVVMNLPEQEDPEDQHFLGFFWNDLIDQGIPNQYPFPCCSFILWALRCKLVQRRGFPYVQQALESIALEPKFHDCVREAAGLLLEQGHQDAVRLISQLQSVD